MNRQVNPKEASGLHDFTRSPSRGTHPRMSRINQQELNSSDRIPSRGHDRESSISVRVKSMQVVEWRASLD